MLPRRWRWARFFFPPVAIPIRSGMPLETSYILKEIDIALAEHSALHARSEFNDCSDLPDPDVQQVIARLVSTIERFASPTSFHARRCAEAVRVNLVLQWVPGLLGALRDDISNDRISSLAELVHAEIFADFLDMAQHLLDNKYKDAAAVIAGSSLEAHLRALCAKYAVAVDDGSGKHKKADRINAELHAAGAYGAANTDLKNVTAWLSTRNDAAHGQYAKYEAPQVGLLIASIRDFMTRRPA
jgi:hypothetical protein